MARDVLAFGPFRLDLRAHRLLRQSEPVPLSAHLVDLLALFAVRAGELLTKDALFEAIWPGVFVTDNTLARAVADLRRALGDDPADPRYIQTVARRGYRFVAEVGPAAPEAFPAGSGGGEETYEELRQFVASVTALERLRVDGLEEVRARLERAAAVLPDYAPVHVALASALTLASEAMRSGGVPDREPAERAVMSARRACELDPGLGEAWATLAFALTSAGRSDQARAAARQAVRLEPGSWRHHFRLAFAAWGEERLRAARRTLELLPGFPYACFLGATVLVARGLLGEARALTAEATAAAPPGASERLPASGLNWLQGAITATDPATAGEALVSFAREIGTHDAGRLYSTEFVLDAHHWRAGLLARLGHADAALADLRAALAIEPQHPRSLAALGALLARDASAEAGAITERADRVLGSLVEGGRAAEAALCHATRQTIGGDGPAAIATLERLLDEAPLDRTGWTLPIEPWQTPLHGHAAFDVLRRRLAQRAA